MPVSFIGREARLRSLRDFDAAALTLTAFKRAAAQAQHRSPAELGRKSD